MNGIPLTFRRRVQSGTDALNNPVFVTVDVLVPDCLIAPISEPSSAREQQAKDQDRDQLRIHLPKTFTGNVSGSEVAWDGKIFSLDSDSVVFMEGNVPTRWNRYFRAEFVSNYEPPVDDLFYLVYWGTSPSSALDATEVAQLQFNEVYGTLPIEFSVDGLGEYLYFSYPVLFGTARVYANGFRNTDWEIATVDIAGTSYYVYRSHYLQHGEQIDIVLNKPQ